MTYIVFCLWHIYQSRYFIYQKKWKFPFYLTYFLKRFLFFELLIQILFQVPIDALHTNQDGDTSTFSWQELIGLFQIWREVPPDNIPKSENAGEVIYKCMMFCMILLQEAVFQSHSYKHYVASKLPMFRILSTMKA